MATGTQDIQVIFDLTGESEVSAADIVQTTDTAQPANDRGFIIQSTDSALNTPVVPPASTAATARYQRYFWIRWPYSSAATRTPIVYIWKPDATSDATYLRWITFMSMLTTDINTLIDAAIEASIEGPAGGDLTGNYPNPTIGNNKVTSAAIKSSVTTDADRAITGDHIKTNTIPISRLKQETATANQVLKVNSAGTAIAFETKSIIALTETGNAGKVPKVNAGGTAFELVATTGTTFGNVIQVKAKALTSGVIITDTYLIPFDTTIPQIGEGYQLVTMQFTPTSVANYLRIKFSCSGHIPGNDNGTVALFVNGVASAVQAKGHATCSSGIGHTQTYDIDYIMLAPSATEFSIEVRAGADANEMYINRTPSLGLYGIGSNSFLIVEELNLTLA